jgi:hypothetical protein
MRKTSLLMIFLNLFLFTESAQSYPFPLPDTGQTKCYNNKEEIPCPQPGEDYYGQDACYTINPPSYTKLDVNGKALPDSATSWVMVRDNVTGLVWEVKTDDGSIHDRDDRYSWHQAQPFFIAQMNAENFGGHADWRMPTIKEQGGLTDYGGTKPTVISTDYFPNVAAGSYWSSTTLAYNTDFAWAGNGSSPKYSSLYVRAVRGGQDESLDYWVRNGDQTITDTGAGLMWLHCISPGKINWKSALSYCEDLSLAGYSDWRLPNRRELRSIVEYTRWGPAMRDPFVCTAVSPYYWSSTTSLTRADYAYLVKFYNGVVGSSHKAVDHYVRAVRGGQVRLLGHLIISAPSQGSTWNIGDRMAISWDTQNISGNAKISISYQGGKDGTFEIVAENTANDGFYSWVVAGPTSVNCMLKIEPLSQPTDGTTQGLFSIITGGPCPQCTGDPVVLQNVEFSSDINCECSATTTITIAPGTIVKEGANVIFKIK